MRRIVFALAILAMVSGPAFAKPTTVKGAKCTACHEGKQAKKTNLNKASVEMLAKHKTEASCKQCHGYANGKLSVIKDGKVVAAK